MLAASEAYMAIFSYMRGFKQSRRLKGRGRFWERGDTRLNGPGRSKLEQGRFLGSERSIVRVSIFSPTPGFKGQPFTALAFITGNINFCVDVPEIQV